jgi:phage/plasmid-associated DNA primase
MRYEGGYWTPVKEGPITQNILRFMDRTPVKVSANRMMSVASLASNHSYARADVWDANRDIAVCKNGTLDLNTFKLRVHRPEAYAMGALPFEYDPDAKAEAWNYFIGACLEPGEWEFPQRVRRVWAHDRHGLRDRRVAGR